MDIPGEYRKQIPLQFDRVLILVFKTRMNWKKGDHQFTKLLMLEIRAEVVVLIEFQVCTETIIKLLQEKLEHLCGSDKSFWI